MRTKAVVLRRTAPVGIDHLLPLILRPDPVLPVIFVREASPRPAQHRNIDLLQRFDHITSHALHVRNVRLFPHIQAFINAPPQVLAEMSVNLRRYYPHSLVFIDIKFHVITPSHFV